MQISERSFEELYFLEATPQYVVVNDEYHGLVVMDYKLNVVKKIRLDDETVINFSIKHKDELFLFCYENQCAFYVNLETGKVNKHDLSDYPDTYFSNIYCWKNQFLYLFADSGKLCVKVDLNTGDIVRVPDSLFNNHSIQQYVGLFDKDILAYDNDRDSALIVRDLHYCIWHLDTQSAEDLNIVALNQVKNDIPSNQIYCRTSYVQNAVIRVSEKNILMTVKEKEKLYIYPSHSTFVFFESKIVCRSGDIIIFALCNDNSCNRPSLLVRYDSFL